MKKIVSLLLAGLMGLTMAVSSMAVALTPGTKLPLETIYSGYFTNGIYYPQYGVNPDLSLLPGTSTGNMFWYGTADCPTKDCTNKCFTYLFPTAEHSFVYAYCKDHGMQLLPTDPAPDTETTTHKIDVHAYTGGDIQVNGNALIYGTTNVKSGETVTVSVVPEYGYIVYAVYVNGYQIGAVESFELKAYRDYSVVAVFKKIDVTRPYTITAAVEGEGNVYAVVNNNSVGAISTLTGTYADEVTLRFVPNGENYSVANVVINGVNMGSISTYNVGRMMADLNVKVTFQWNSPYTDIAKEHMAAVEYVTEIDVMGTPNKYFNTDKFMGKNTVTVRAMACYLAELSDVENKLDTADKRVAWAIEKGLLTAEENQQVKTTWVRACDMLNAYIRLLEKDSKVVFKALENVTASYDIAKTMGLVTEVAYKADAAITRYDMAEICYAVAQLEVK